MNGTNEDICQRMAVDILNAALLLLKKSNRYEKARNQSWNHPQQLAPKGMELMEEAFKKTNMQDFNSLSAKSVLAGEKLVAMYSIST